MSDNVRSAYVINGPTRVKSYNGGVQTVLYACHDIIVAAGYGAPTEREVRRLLLIPRALADGGHDGFRARYPRLARGVRATARYHVPPGRGCRRCAGAA